MRRNVQLGLVMFSALVLPGCFMGLSCDDEPSLAGPFCLFYSKACCPTDQAGVVGCGSLTQGFVFPCAGGAHGGCVCVEPGSTNGVVSEESRVPTYTLPLFTFDVGLPFAGMSPAHRLTFDTTADSWQTYSGAVTYSDGFGFNGFTALGPAGTQIGSYGFDLDADDKVEAEVPVRALTADTAYADVNFDGVATAFDPTIQHLANVPTQGARTFNLLLPYGGDFAPNLARGPRSFRVHIRLNAGILVNPGTPDAYDVRGTFTSVDPSTGDANDGTGSSPFTVIAPPVAIAIVPSPLEILDHFLCYKTKASKGNICNDTAGTNRGGLCVTDAECGGTAGACVKPKFAKGVQTGLAEKFGGFTTRTADVKKPIDLCTPADKNGEGRHDTVTHLRGYQIKDVKGSAPRDPLPPLRIVNPLGTLAVQIKAADRLYEPTAKALGAPAAALGMHAVDRYQCYPAKALAKRCDGDPARKCKTSGDCGLDGPCLGKFPKGLQVTVTDQFAAAKRFDVTKPTRLCSPALANGEPIQSPGGYLMCYKVKPAANVAKHTPIVGTIHTASRFGRERVDTVTEAELCVPSLDLTST